MRSALPTLRSQKVGQSAGVFDPAKLAWANRHYLRAADPDRIARLAVPYLAEHGLGNLQVEIHIDIGAQGETRDLIREVVGMVVGSGFAAKIKPEAFGASSVADKHTK